jgi:hypothetical protein
MQCLNLESVDKETVSDFNYGVKVFLTSEGASDLNYFGFNRFSYLML